MRTDMPPQQLLEQWPGTAGTQPFPITHGDQRGTAPSAPAPQDSARGVTSNLEAMRMAVEPMSCSLSLMLTTSTR